LGLLALLTLKKCVFSPTNQPKKEIFFFSPQQLITTTNVFYGKKKRERLVVVKAVNLFDFCRVEF
jgi:hypothetical protein